ncbi:hypothetical protein [Thermosulfidibacter takaii]|uniref:hypothetical protein n=1 Tax=Thermosulfidibacter takaii TaxID=412593 RepID=UPI0008397B9C|nr:hypothetical protein [Thermosulfidibacter takaii]
MPRAKRADLIEEAVSTYCEMAALVKVLEGHMLALHDGQGKAAPKALRVAQRIKTVAEEMCSLLEKAVEVCDG